MSASAAGSGGAVCPSTAAGGAVIFFFLCVCTAAGSGFFCARRPLRLGQSLLVLRLRCLLELVVRLLPLRCMVCLALPGAPGVPGPMHCQVTFLSFECRRRSASGGFDWRDVAQVAVPSLVASSRRSGGSTGLPRFEVLDQVFLPPASGRSFIGGASAWFFLPLWLTAVSLACGLAFAVLLGGGGFPRGY